MNTLITGAAGGIGTAVAHACQAAGRSVALLDTDADLLAKVRADLPHPDQAICVVADVTSPLEPTFRVVEEKLGQIDHVVGAAGVLRPAELMATTDEDWHFHLAVNATGTFHLLRAAATSIGARGGSVVIVGSNAARVPRQRMAAYAASKAAAAAVTRVAGLELARSGIRCNVVEPGSTDTAMQRDLWPDAELGARTAIAGDLADHRVGIPLGRIADPEDIADVVVFLLSDAARHITMQQLFVDGGASL